MAYLLGMNRQSRIKNQVDFGFEDINSAEKTERVQSVFSSVAQNYDLMNDLMSLGAHRLWKKALISQIAPQADEHLIDAAGGTGDISREFLRAGGGKATVVDLNPGMLAAGKKKGGRDLEWVNGNAETLPLPDSTFDVYTISFGLRNVTDKDAALREAARVLKPGGRFYCLEFCPNPHTALKPVYDLYSFHLLPWLGDKVAKDRAAYQYLVESIRRFPDPVTLKKMMEMAGLDVVQYRPLMGGICAIHSGWRV
jgi:demethylmenaquinone methyltransferase/2-methoxy-6-polyprenyl-1,4-benzoquinol methylase